MSVPRLCARLAKIEAQWRQAHVAAVLARVRQCSSADLQSSLLDVLTSVDLATGTAIMEQLTNVEFEAFLGPELCGYLDSLPQSEYAALASGDQAATRRMQRWIRAQHTQGDLSR